MRIVFRSSHRRCSVRKGVLRNFSKFTGKHLTVFYEGEHNEFAAFLEINTIVLFFVLREKCPYSEFSGPYVLPFGRIQSECRKYRPGKLRIRTLFTQCGCRKTNTLRTQDCKLSYTMKSDSEKFQLIAFARQSTIK